MMIGLCALLNLTLVDAGEMDVDVECTVHLEQARVLGGLDDQMVKLDIKRGKALVVRVVVAFEGFRELAHNSTDILSEIRWTLPGCNARRIGFQRCTRAKEVDDIVSRESYDLRAQATAFAYERLCLQSPQGIAHWGRADTKRRSDLADREHSARDKLAIEDLLPQDSMDPFLQVTMALVSAESGG